MRVRFLTRCGCSRDDDLKYCPPEYYIHLRPQLTAFPKAIEGVPPTDTLEVRRFVRQHAYPAGGVIKFIYMEAE